jgi:ribosomal protein L29
MKEIKEMKEEDLMKMLKALRAELDRRRAEAWERYTGFKYPLKKTLKKEVYDEKGRA